MKTRPYFCRDCGKQLNSYKLPQFNKWLRDNHKDICPNRPDSQKQLTMSITYANKTIRYIPNDNVEEATVTFDSPDNPLWNSEWFLNLIGETNETQN